MNIFVASWFFPPATSSEGIVTYKLLRNSQHQYDVCSSTSRQWGYKAAMGRRDEQNLTCYPVETDSIDEWVDACVAKFEELHPQRDYACVMTRSTPPESILVGLKIKEKHPEVKWIASLADPVSNNPYELKAYVDECKTLTDAQKAELRQDLLDSQEAKLDRWEKRPEPGIQLLCKLKRWENAVLKQADLVISPTATQLRYLLQKRAWSPKCFPLPHSYDPTFYPPAKPRGTDKVVLSFIGYSDVTRSLVPFVQAVRLLKERNCPFLDRLDMRFIGNNPRALQDMVLDYFLEDVIHFRGGVDYYESLACMQDSDWLLHVDAFFHTLSTGGSIFFAGKLADYMGAGRPILALTGQGSPAHSIVTQSGGVCLLPWDIEGLADQLEQILMGAAAPRLNGAYIQQFSSPAVAKAFDARVAELCGLTYRVRTADWTLPAQEPNPAGEKLVSVCVPSYNVQRYLERCLNTLVRHPYAQFMEVLVVDDGSKDHTAQIGRLFEDHFSGIVRLISKPNGGHGSTVNRALAESTGRYFMVVDGDDWVDSRELARLLADIHSGKIDADIISSNYHEIDMESAALTPKTQAVEVPYFKKLTWKELDLTHIYFTLASSMIKAALLKKMNAPLQEHTFYVDVEYILFPVPYLETAEFVDYWIYKYCRGNEEQSVYLPTMVARYDHHDRVMRRVLQYERDHDMTPEQQTYYDAILKRLLYTHYALCLIYDEDKERGYARGKDFDAYLQSASPRLAQWIGGEMKLVRIVRLHRFDPASVRRSPTLKLGRAWARLKHGLLHGPLTRRLVYNKLTAKLAQLPFFTSGPGAKLKSFLKRKV